jgi:nucleoid-associated protein YgaU
MAAAGVAAGALVASPLLAVGPAEAASDRTWNRLAQCESGGRWHINTGNGYYGGLQFSASTWRGYGGGKYADYAHRASREQQIRIAEKVQNGQGWGAWPSCSSQLGLSGNGGGGGGGDSTRDRQHTYVVKRGDTLRSIARAKDVTGGADRLFRLNKVRLDGRRDNLRVGMFLRLYDWR